MRGDFVDKNQLYLFNEGKYHHAFDTFGSHIVGKGAYFTVWVPDAKSVRVTGSFDSWKGGAKLSSLGDSGVWSAFVPGVRKGDIYKYSIETDDGRTLMKSDPFAFFAEKRPATASVVYEPEYKWNDRKWMRSRDRKDCLKNPMNIYEVHLGSWRKPADSEFLSYAELADELVPYVKEMGYTHIEIMPVMEHPLDASWGYQVTGFYAPTSRYGTPEQFMYLVDKAHQNGISVILDWVPGHFCTDAHGLFQFNGHDLFEDGLHPDWGTAKFDFARPQVRSFLLSNANFWFGRYHADAIRVDGVSSMLYLNFGVTDESKKKYNKFGDEGNLEAVSFLGELSQMVAKYHSGARLMAEESTAWPLVTYPPSVGGLGFNFKWNMGWMHDTLEYFSTDFPYREANHRKLTFSMMYAFSENYILPFSHDEIVHGKASLIGKMPGDYWRQFAGLRLLSFYQMTHPGAKLNFMGNEIAQFREWHEYEETDWFLCDKFEAHRKHREFVRCLNALYLSDRALWKDDHSWNGFSWIDADNAKQQVLIFQRRFKSKKDYIVLNCDVNPYTRFRIGVDSAGLYGEAFNTDDEAYGGSGSAKWEPVKAERIPYHGRKYSIVIDIPPLGGIMIRRIPQKRKK